MCLIAVAHRVSETFPLVIAANRDEFYERPALPAAPWNEDANVVGGRDLRAGGSWLAVAAGGRFAAVTNIRGGEWRPSPWRCAPVPLPASGERVVPKAPGEGRHSHESPSRGLLVSRFVLSDAGVVDFANGITRAEYAGFHLILGDGTTIAHVTNANDAPPSIVEPGSIFAVSNGQPGEDWPKVELARAAMRSAIGHPETLLDFLTTRRGGPIEQEVFVAVPERGYGTRSSTVIVADKNGAVDFIERAAPSGAEVRWRLPSRS
ncbi:MAG TPA: NRDE family protein [Thermoanaerobaculia bacterium]|jgi:uncharacterized protein with NRDE domain